MGRHSSSTLPVSPLAALIGIATLTWMAVVMTTPAELATDRQALRGLREARNGTREMEKLRKAMAQLHEGIDAAAQRPAAPAAPPPPPAAARRQRRRDFRGRDISGDGVGEGPFEDSSREACCALCAERSWCMGAVLSGAEDEPPRACWLKADATRTTSKPGVVACVPRARAAPPPLEAPASTATCEFAAGLDVAGQDLRDGPASGATEATCCEACRADAGCVAAVLSAPGDDPPRACWLKRSAEPAAAKDGVRLRAGAPDAPTDAAELARRRAAIAAAVKHAWQGYRDRAFGRDSVAPVSGRAVGSGFDMAVTLVDSLDTLWIVGLKEEFKEARDFVATEAFGKKLRSPPSSASIFETTIRVLGGLLGAYEVSRDKIFVTRALDIGNVIHGKLDKRSGVCPPSFGARSGGGCPSLAHAGTTQLELIYLARVSGDPKFLKTARLFYDHIKRAARLEPGLYAQCVGASSGKITLGAEADSFYEYLPKVWLLQGGADRRATRTKSAEPLDFEDAWQMYNDALDGMEQRLTSRGDDGLLYLDNLNWRGGSAFSRESAMEHLQCFVPGWVALGAAYQDDPARAARHLALADELATTCFAMYDKQPTKIGPERVKRKRMDLSATDTKEYILRPEAAEGWWYLSILPGLDHMRDKYRAWSWQSFQAIDDLLRAPFGHASMRDVSKPRASASANRLDRMESPATATAAGRATAAAAGPARTRPGTIAPRCGARRRGDGDRDDRLGDRSRSGVTTRTATPAPSMTPPSSESSAARAPPRAANSTMA
ncbi:mannosyl-oligosaccharide 1,2-alpha-mannosidase [Aureococcus anophagefferens]|nr:mannosyl-oligosaccharide 1,2-alpha-mannosidase [Aureococcus anophagefferens]